MSSLFRKITANKPLIFILLVASGLRFIGLLPNISHPDEGYVQIISSNLLENIITHADFNPQSFKYGSFIYFAQALFYAPVFLVSYFLQNINVIFSSGFTAKALSFDIFFDEAYRKLGEYLTFAGRFQVAILGVGTVYLTYLIANRLFNKRTALWAAFFIAVSPLHVRDSHYITTDVPFVFFLLIAFLFTIRAFQSKTVKDYLLAGIFIGFSTTVRYFPVGFLLLPLLTFFTFQKTASYFKKVAITVFASIIGVIAGMPFLIFDPNATKQLTSDFEKYILPWYQTSLSNYFFSFLKGDIQDPSLLIPQFFKAFHASYIFFLGLTPLVAVISIIGLYLVLKNSFRKFVFLSVIPAFVFIYISFYIPSTYERLNIPILPFLAIFAGVTINHILTKSTNTKVFLVAVIAIIPLIKSTSATIACSQPKVQIQSKDWVDRNIPESAKIGYLTMVSVPPRNYAAWYALEPNVKLSLEEADGEGLDHSFINAGRLDYVTYPFFNNFFVPPYKLYENSYESLILAEYQSASQQLQKIDKPWMCDFSRIYYFKLPEEVIGTVEKSREYLFGKQEEIQQWHIQNVDDTGTAILKYSDESKISNSGSLEYQQTSYSYTPPRIVSEKISVSNSKNFKFDVSARTTEELSQKVKLITRIDFYDDKSPSIFSRIKNNLLLFSEGSTPVFFEKKRESLTVQNDTLLPGRVLRLSPATVLTNQWQQISVDAQVPPDIEYVVFSIQPVSTDKSDIYFDNISISSD